MYFNGLQTVEVQNYSFCAASKDYRRWISVLSSKTIGHLKKKKNVYAMFCHAHAHNVITLKRSRLTLAEVPSQCLQVERSNTKSDTIYKKGMSDDFELGGEDDMEPMSSVTFSMLLRKVFFFFFFFFFFALSSI